MNKKGKMEYIFFTLIAVVVLIAVMNFGKLGSFVVNQQGGFNIDMEQDKSFIAPNDILKINTQVIFSQGSWLKPSFKGSISYFVDGMYQSSSTWEKSCIGTSDKYREFPILEEIQNYDGSKFLPGNHKVTGIVINSILDDCSNFEPKSFAIYDTCVASLGLTPKVTTIEQFKTAVEKCVNVAYQAERSSYFTAGTSIPSLSWIDKIKLFFSNILIKFGL